MKNYYKPKHQLQNLICDCFGVCHQYISYYSGDCETNLFYFSTKRPLVNAIVKHFKCDIVQNLFVIKIFI